MDAIYKVFKKHYVGYHLCNMGTSIGKTFREAPVPGNGKKGTSSGCKMVLIGVSWLFILFLN